MSQEGIQLKLREIACQWALSGATILLAYFIFYNPYKMAYSKGDLVAAIATSTGATKKMSADMLDAMLAEITAQLKGGNNVTLTGFGTFKMTRREARNGVNPATGAKIQISARNAATFKAGKALKEAIN